MASKYESLENHLMNLSLATKETTLTFAQVNELITSQLPPSAFKHPEWWSNQTDTSNRPQAKAWMSSGFLVDGLSQSRNSGWVRFRRK